MKTKVVKYFVLASALAFMNCGDESTSTITDALGDKVPGVEQQSDSLAQTGDPAAQAGDPAAQAGDPAAQAGDPAAQTGDPAAQAGDPAAQAGDPAAQAGDPAAQAGDPAAQAGDPAAQAGDPAAQAGDPAAQTGDPAAQAGDPAAQTGDPAAQAGDPAAQKDTTKTNTPAVTSSSSEDKKIESSSSEAPKGIFLAEGKDEEKRQLDIEYKEGQGPDGQSVLAYPKQLSTTQKHGIVVWGPGGGEKPGNYPDMIKDLASHGFVVIGIRESPGNGSLAIEAINWLEKQNSDAGSPFNGKLDMTKVGCSGHSMGGLESEQAAIKDKRVITAFLNNSGDQGSGAFVNIPKEKTAGVVFGEKGSERSNAIRDYQSAKETPACMIEMTGGPNNGEGGWGHGSGPWDGRAITIAWMRWQLGGEDFRKADFVGTSGKYINGKIINHQGNWKGECKNF